MGILTTTTQTLDCHFGSKGLIAWNRFGQWTAPLLRGKDGLQSKLWTSITCNNTIYFYSISRTLVVNDGLAGVCVSHERNVKCAVRLCPPLVWGVHWLSVFGTPQVMGNIYLPPLPPPLPSLDPWKYMWKYLMLESVQRKIAHLDILNLLNWLIISSVVSSVFSLYHLLQVWLLKYTNPASE